MSSQKSTAESVEMRAPKRERGRQRVANLLAAASKIIAERGYDAATMTAIAVEAGASIGSLYQFFPTKAALAEVLLDQYGARLGDRLNALLALQTGLTTAKMSEGLVAMMLDLTADRTAVMAILDARDAGPEAGEARRQLRARLEDGLERLLRIVRPDLKGDALVSLRLSLLYMLKAIPAMVGDAPQLATQVRDDMTRALACYISG
ncbi:MAG: TetR/AcrR family transcriptional regulator [Asticcacaulis sp.]|uniref:TetR/AcrR family transcriptional regulator n=1 Tax=Asticcacaulis sp. TaxID=1872648 RepID=UPI003F7B4283